MPDKLYLGSRVGEPHQQLKDLIVEVRHGDGRREKLNPRFDLRNHSPSGFECAYGGSGPAQLALAMLADYTGDDRRAERQYQDFKWDVIAILPAGVDWIVNGSQIKEWLEANPSPAPTYEEEME